MNTPNRDIDGLLELMTDDAVYAASVGPEPGRTFRGRPELVAGFRTMFEHDAGARIEQGEPLVLGGWAVSTWAYHFVRADGSPWSGVRHRRHRFGRLPLLLGNLQRRAAHPPLGQPGKPQHRSYRMARLSRPRPARSPPLGRHGLQLRCNRPGHGP
ncbi:nuclear transport factor 2 family protein [Nonomuraea sp. NPDC050680]|uniref:nuclear transport factor 2 family protein n=1 Tax=Nonomuraea sp. NPDC050680 TaxID=3154630 RepID=UPI0033EE4817